MPRVGGGDIVRPELRPTRAGLQALDAGDVRARLGGVRAARRIELAFDLPDRQALLLRDGLEPRVGPQPPLLGESSGTAWSSKLSPGEVTR